LYAQDVLSGTSPYDSGVAPINDQTGNNMRPAAYHSASLHLLLPTLWTTPRRRQV